MNDSTDPLSGEVSVSVKLEENGFAGKAKSRALAALDRLIGSAVDIPGALLERRATLIRARTDAQRELVAVEAEAAKRKLAASTGAGEALLDAHFRDVGRKLENRAAVAERTVEVLRELPPPPAPDSENEEPEAIDEDWLNMFSGFAENASSEHMRDLWGRVLAGEIRQPKSFSLSTLRLVSELDREIAVRFEKYVGDRLSDGFLPKPPEIKNELLLDLTFLEEVGLLQEANGNLARTLNADEGGFCYFPNGKKLLRLKPRTKKNLRVELIRITRVGREIASILPAEPDERALKVIADRFRANCETVEICDILRHGTGMFPTSPFVAF